MMIRVIVFCLAFATPGAAEFGARRTVPPSTVERPAARPVEPAVRGLDLPPGEARFEACKIEVAKDMAARIWHKLEFVPFRVVAGPIFLALPFDDKLVAIKSLNCFVTLGQGGARVFDVLHWQTGKVVGRFTGWDFEMQ